MKRSPEEILSIIERIRLDLSTKKKNSMYHNKLFAVSGNGNVLFKDSFITKLGLNKYIKAIIFRSLSERRNYIATQTPSGWVWGLLKTNYGSDLDSSSVPKDMVVMNFQFNKELFKHDTKMNESTSLIKRLLRENLLTEGVVSQGDLNRLEKELDALFADVGIDIDFTHHFFERVNDARNGKDITIDELRFIFKNAYGKYKDVLGKYGDGFEAVFNNRQTAINIPFVLQWDRHNNELDLATKTIMRTKQFYSKEPFLPVNDATPVKPKDNSPKDKWKPLKLTNGQKVRYYELSSRFEDKNGQEIPLDSIEDLLPDEVLEKVLDLAENTNLNESEAITLYHGSETKISKFVDDFVGGEDANDQEGPGIYFTTSWENARSYGEYMYTVKIRPNKIVSTTKGETAPEKELEWLITNAPDWEDNAYNWGENPQAALPNIVSDFIQYNENPHNQFLQAWYDFYRHEAVHYVRNMTKLGYDAVKIGGLNSMITGENEITHFIVLNPAIIEFVKLEHDA